MYKDPTEFRKRFKRWKETGEYSLPRFADGYEAFFNTLPENQKRGSYPTRRYWELNGKPKDFAEAVGKGMYTVLNDNGTLNWHANSITYNENTDQYEFMKANYHPTRWMELVYGYNQSPEFLKEWKVLYNGPMLSDRYVRREKPGLKTKGGQLPKFVIGKGVNTPVTTGGAGVTTPYQQQVGIPKEAQSTAQTLERIANFTPYVGTIPDWLSVAEGQIGKVPAAVIGTVADIFLPGFLQAVKGAKYLTNMYKTVPRIVDKIKYKRAADAATRKATANGAYLAIGLYLDFLDDQGLTGGLH